VHRHCHLSNQLALHSTKYQLPLAYTATSFPCDKLNPVGNKSSQELILPRLILLMVKAADLEIRMHGDK
ncbi:hypothetical protein Tco_0379940, partial [Tanacetum coccineum]